MSTGAQGSVVSNPAYPGPDAAEDTPAAMSSPVPERGSAETAQPNVNQSEAHAADAPRASAAVESTTPPETGTAIEVVVSREESAPVSPNPHNTAPAVLTLDVVATTPPKESLSVNSNPSSMRRTSSTGRRPSNATGRFGSVALNRAAHSRPASKVSTEAETARPFYQHRLFRPVVAISLYFFSGLLFYTQYEGWSFVDSLYFCIVVVTTIGYGDNDPIETDGGKLFTALFALLGVSVVFGSLSIVLDVIQEKSKAVAAQAAKAAVAVSFNAPDKAEGDRQSQSVPEQTTIAVDESGTDSAAIPDAQPLSQERGVVGKIVTSARGYYNQSPFLRALLWMLAVMSVGIIFVVAHKRVEKNDDDTEPAEDNYTFVEALYWVCITGTTVGFGDFSPETEDARLFAIFYLIFLVTATGGFLGEVGQFMDGDRTSKRDAVLSRGLSTALIAELDEDGDGEVTKVEWLKGMLVALDEADGELIDIILKQFDNLDTDGSGSLDIDDIRAATEQVPPSGHAGPTFADQVKAHVDDRDDGPNLRVGVHQI